MEHFTEEQETLTRQRWKQIPSQPDYEASTHGNIRNKHTKQICEQIKTARTYNKIQLNNNKKTLFVHRLIYETFIGKLIQNHHVAHYNNNIHDNRPANLYQYELDERYLKNKTIAGKYKPHNEQWKQIQTHKKYEASTWGRIKTYSGKLIQPTINEHGYSQVKIPKNNQLDRIIYQTFRHKITYTYTILHLNGNKQDNHIRNLIPVSNTMLSNSSNKFTQILTQNEQQTQYTVYIKQQRVISKITTCKTKKTANEFYQQTKQAIIQYKNCNQQQAT